VEIVLNAFGDGIVAAEPANLAHPVMALDLYEFTVKNYLYRMMKQVDAGTRYEAVETVRAQLDEV
jgi:hypothetical protein